MFKQIGFDLVNSLYKVASGRSIHFPLSPKQLTLATIAFNNPVVIAIQILLLRKFMLDDYVLIIADNSSDSHARVLLRNVCAKLGTHYVSIPRFPMTLGPSDSHAIALNWVYSNIFLSNESAYFGYLDHDIYPFCKINIASALNGYSAVGLKQTRGNLWYLWPGLFFFKNTFFQSAHVDFRPDPKQALYTGGRLYFSQKYQSRTNEILFLDESYYFLDTPIDMPQSSTYSLIGDWIHTRNGSYWMSCPPREDAIINFLCQKTNYHDLQREVAHVLS